MENKYVIMESFTDIKGLIPMVNPGKQIVEFPSKEFAQAVLCQAKEKGWDGIALIIPADIAYNFEKAPIGVT